MRLYAADIAANARGRRYPDLGRIVDPHCATASYYCHGDSVYARTNIYANALCFTRSNTIMALSSGRLTLGVETCCNRPEHPCPPKKPIPPAIIPIKFGPSPLAMLVGPALPVAFEKQGPVFSIGDIAYPC